MSDKNHVTLNLNEELNGIELIFQRKPSEETLALLRKDKLYRWHPVKKLWYAKNTDRAKEVANHIMSKLDGRSISETEKMFGASPESDGLSESNVKTEKPNTFASYYNTVTESIPIYEKGADVGLRDRSGTYIADLNIYYHVYNRGYDSEIQILDLEHAQKRGKACTKYALSVPVSEGKDLISLLYNRGIHNVSELWQAIKENGAMLEEITIHTYDKRSVDVFSPFIEVKPLKTIPEKWTRANFIQALLSGQIYKGEVNYRYTDDYAFDAAYNFNTGCGLNLARTAQDVIENWYSTASISGSPIDGDKTKAVLHYSTYSNSSDTLYFDLTFNHEKGHTYRIEEAAAIERFNQSLKNSVIHPDAGLIDKGIVYEIQLIDRNRNNGIYDTKTETIQGYLFKEYLSEQDNYHLEDLVGYHEMEITPEHYYVVGLGYQEELKNDSRIIQADPHTFLVSGKALLEFCNEGIYLDKIHEDYNVGNTYEKVRSHIESFQSGRSYFMFSDARVDYDASLLKLETEAKRVKENRGFKLDTLLHQAECKKTHVPTKGNIVEFPQRV